MNRILLLVLFFSTCLVQSCSVSKNNSYSKANHQQSCAKPISNVYFFYEGEETDFKYTELGEIEVHVREHASDREVMDRLKQEAKSNCANALIQIKSAYKTEMGEFETGPNSYEVYTADYYSAIAVYIEEDSDFAATYSANRDDFIEKSRSNDQAKKIARDTGEVVLSILYVAAEVFLFCSPCCW